MKKQEFIHLHGLLAEVAEYCADDDVDLDLEEYDSLGTRPTSIHRSKTEHKDAVLALAAAVTDSFDDERVASVAADPANAD